MGIYLHLFLMGFITLYADDIDISVDGSDTSSTNLKISLYCFEWLLGLKFIFHKNEVIICGYS
jgi:hypothetical protein